MILDVDPKSDAPPASTSATTSPGPLRLTDKPGSKDEKELVAALERRCKSLEAQLTKANRDLKSACSDAARARNETASSKKQDEIWSMIQRECLASRLKKQYRELSNQNEEKVKELEATLGTAKQIKKFEDDIEELRKDNQERRKENIEWKDMMNAVKDSGSE
jgi:chromosome segregation ATPase